MREKRVSINPVANYLTRIYVIGSYVRPYARWAPDFPTEIELVHDKMGEGEGVR